ncbi:queuine tRNA-ribosyltransferase, putative [Plasmodium knowlesi strain H]|uniref:Queuine tRNA-ribosyltransferase, putative n=3 Tax=Plasmodium knowlesi TaxID=5850 RepID=A0A5K1V8S1_PLAKH|nr:queuine tRNA-ribosyltransferase, putative [Plasmodium knowlesi strain H]OTN66683.1 putative Queuine tRNA-ribosyltransferase [Plasmodium knowlesi]CAA9986845.1 queuine tRNA-ribosyltransferase, putative [Plasmodium knowlesi strain H]SBO25299.1 queuine tRNA-ribosyltransferase, putative [Plasmodium knowlesi strain H]VVS76319.1 queuine tRNA-ribosyltransferase, putative [Plasmodium knowlesi strain H]|eukprot:XP_002260671.1 tRNA-ribosyltransferase,putative [Plasmodium knowlesi strain H]
MAKMEESSKYRVNKIKDLETPTTTILTNDIQPEYINMELLRKIEINNFILNCPLQEVYKNLEVYEKAKEYFSRHEGKKSKSYLHSFSDFDNSYRYMNVRNVLTNNFSININKNITMKQSNHTIIFSIDDFCRCVHIFEPDIFCIPSEEIKINEEVGKKKKVRIITLMDEFLKKIKNVKENQVSGDSVCIVTIPSTIHFDKGTIEEMLNKYDTLIGGFMLSGIGYDESNEERTSHLNTILAVLPKEKLKLIQLSIGTPIEILHSIYHGIDIIESNFPYELARNGKAINMHIKMESMEEKCTNKMHDIRHINFQNKEIFIINLNDEKYALDYSPITDNSPRNETKSYVHHLLKCQELTANVILSYHNLYMYSMFFQEIRTQIRSGNFLSYISWFVQRHQLG